MSNFNSRSFTIEGMGGDDGEIALDILNDNGSKDITLKDAIIDLYLNVKIRNSEDVRLISALFHNLFLTNIINCRSITTTKTS